MKDLFVDEVKSSGLVDTSSKGYAATPGTGPKGETCKTCKHLVRLRYSRTYLKCAKARKVTKGPGTDIRAKSKACCLWEKGGG